MTMQYRGHDVVDQHRKLVGTIDDVLYDTQGEPTWAVVDVGLLRASHYVPVSAGYTAEDGTFVVPFDKHFVTSAPKADRSHTLDPSTEEDLKRYYGMNHEESRFTN